MAGRTGDLITTSKSEEDSSGPMPRGRSTSLSRPAWLARIPFGVWLVLAAFLLRVIAAVAVDRVLYASGHNGFLGADDVAYDRIAWQQAQYWKGVGPAVAPGNAYLLSVYTYLIAALYWLLGHLELAVKLMNCLFGALTAGVIYRTTRLLFGDLAGRLSGLAAAFFPSTFLWSLFNLKDALFVFLVALVLWLLTALLVTARHWLVIPILLGSGLIGGIRLYALALLGFVIPGTLVLQSGKRFPGKWQAFAMLVVGCVIVFRLSGALLWATAQIPFLDQQRYAAALGARSSYIPTPAAIPTSTSTIAGAALVPATSTAAGASGATGAGTAGSAATATTVATVLGGAALSGDSGTSTQVLPGGIHRGELRSLLAWLPVGFAYTLGAPFPWAANRTIERLTIPEMLLWYVAVVLAVVAVIIHWRLWSRYIHILGYIAGMLLIFAIAQGNLGTLVRQRGMIIPFTLIFSGAGAAWVWSHWYSWRTRTRLVSDDANPIRDLSVD